jgi:hypothetical protein
MKSREELRDALADVIREQSETFLPSRGVSMGPELASAEALIVRGIRHGRPRRGQIVLYRRGALWVAHRVIRLRADGGCLTLGDANPVFDFPPVRPDELLGVVTGTVVDGRASPFGFADRLAGTLRWLRGLCLMMTR